MAILEAQAFYEKVQSKESSFIFLYGEEIYLLKQAQKFILDTYQADPNDVFNFESFDLTETDWEKVSESIGQLPMMGSQRTVIVKNIDALPEKDLEQLENDLRPLDPAPLVLFISNDIDKKKKLFKLLTQKCLSCEFKPPYENQIPQWVNYIADQKGLKIKQDAIHTLISLIGTNLSELDTEIEKIALNIAPEKLIEEEKVTEILGRTRQDTVFSFIDELFYRKEVEALTMLTDLLKNGQNEVGVVTLIARHLRILLQTQRGLNEGLKGQALATRIGVSPYFLSKYLQQANFWREEDLKDLLLNIAELETQLKSSSVPHEFLMENLVLQFHFKAAQAKTVSKRNT